MLLKNMPKQSEWTKNNGMEWTKKHNNGVINQSKQNQWKQKTMLWNNYSKDK